MKIIILAFIKPQIIDFHFVAFIAVAIHVLFTMIVLMSYRYSIKIIFLAAFFARLAFMYWDIYARHIFLFPGSGGDSVGFYVAAIRVSHNLSLLSETIYGGMYAKVNGVLFYLIGPQQMVGHYINVLLGFSVIYILYKIFNLLEVEEWITLRVILIAAFFLNTLVMSSIFLREMYITFFVVASLYFFIKWFKLGKIIFMLTSILMIPLASLFHSGVVGILIGYSFAFLFYCREESGFRFTVRTLFAFLFILLISSVIFTQYEDIFLGKFSKVENIEDVIDTANDRRGDSAYLTGLTINNPIQLVLFGPIKAFYFLTAPLPMNWRGLFDVITFFTDSILYLGVLFYFVKNRKYFKTNRALIFTLLITITSVSLIFGIGIANAGTALRHRHKILPLILLFLAVMMDSKQKEKLKLALEKVNGKILRGGRE